MNLMSNVVSIVVAGGLLAFAPNKEKIKAEADPLRNLKQTAFKKGEFLRYDVSYGFFDTAEATLEIKKTSKKIELIN